MAPRQSFSTRTDFRKRIVDFQFPAELTEDLSIPQPDPLVIRFIHGGCVLITYWDKEGEYLKEVMRWTR